jgi:hypothetical protein
MGIGEGGHHRRGRLCEQVGGVGVDIIEGQAIGTGGVDIIGGAGYRNRWGRYHRRGRL